MAAAAPYAAAGLGGLFQAIGGAKPKSSTSTYNSSGTQSAELDPKQSKVNKAIFQQLLQYIRRGPTVEQGDRNTMRSQVNQGFNAANTNLEANLAARGFANSGKYGAGVRSNTLEKQKQTQTGEAGLQQSAWQKFMNMLGMGFQFDQPRTFNSSQQGTQTSTGAGTPWQSSLGGGLSDLSSMLWLRNMGGMGGSGGGGYPTLPVSGGVSYGSLPAYDMPCAVAEELYGKSDLRTLLVRAFLLEQARRSVRWALAVGLYRLTGRHIARLIRVNQTARRGLKGLFDRLAVEAMNSWVKPDRLTPMRYLKSPSRRLMRSKRSSKRLAISTHSIKTASTAR